MEQMVLDIMREAIMTMIKVAAPMLLTALIVGLVISIFQTATSIQEQTLAFVPKILAVFLVIIIFGSWITNILLSFMTRMFTSFSLLL
jgi:flagellar biosynthetic protein FliQ